MACLPPFYKAFSSKANKGNDLDNNAVVIEIANLRHLKAVLLGYTSHAEFILEERMAKTPGTVQDFLDELLDKSLPKAKEEFIELEAFAKAKGAELPLQRWDGAYYSEKLKKMLLTKSIFKSYCQFNKKSKFQTILISSSI